jgi:hypothetical protein
MSIPASKTEIAQTAATMVVTGAVAKQTKELILDHTSANEDSILVEPSSWAMGAFIGHLAKPYTDTAVVKTIGAFQSFREKRKNKKSEDKS